MARRKTEPMSGGGNPVGVERQSYGRMLQITEGEVGRIILDIHDGPVQHIFASLSQLNLVRRQLSKAACADYDLAEQIERIDRSVRMLESALNDIRTFMGTFRPPEFERRDLLSVLEGLAIQHEATSGNPVLLEVADALPEVALPVKIALYRILQEALANSTRHGGADTHWVRLTSDGLTVTMEVYDSGAGFDPAAVFARGDDPGYHLGLSGMRERAELLGGRLLVESAPGAGARITATVPRS
jgi:signal transduction histidine kinase